jgi:hypothetical protein
LHAVLGLGEPSILALPDAVHTGWLRERRVVPTPVVEQSSPLSPPDCTPPVPSDLPPGQFGACAALAPPLLFEIPAPSGATYSVTWSSVAGADSRYTLEESTANTFADAAVISTGSAATTQRLDGRAEGPYFYRVRAEAAGQVSPWSNIVAVRNTASITWRVLTPNEFVPDALEAIHLAALRAGAASGDLQVLLSVAGHYREDDTLRHVNELAMQLSYDRDRTLSFGALYHPWTIGRDEALGTLRRNPPDGILAGFIAARTTARGAWVAPANEPLQGILALDPPLAPDRRLDLQEGHVNVVRQEADGFRVLCADTLSDDDEVRLLNVRRLMSLLYRLVLREGTTYVFEPNGDSFRRLVERAFESLLDDLFVRGAFAGATSADAFLVDASPALNTSRDQDEGRMIVELKVAPSRPLSYLTIRLLQHGQRELTVVEG